MTRVWQINEMIQLIFSRIVAALLLEVLMYSFTSGYTQFTFWRMLFGLSFASLGSLFFDSVVYERSFSDQLDTYAIISGCQILISVVLAIWLGKLVKARS